MIIVGVQRPRIFELLIKLQCLISSRQFSPPIPVEAMACRRAVVRSWAEPLVDVVTLLLLSFVANSHALVSFWFLIHADFEGLPPEVGRMCRVVHDVCLQMGAGKDQRVHLAEFVCWVVNCWLQMQARLLKA